MRLQLQRGFTLLEMLIVIAILGLVASFALFPFGEFRRNQVLTGATENALSLLSEARGKSLASVDNSRHGVYFAPSQLTLFRGDAYPGVIIRALNLPAGASIGEVTLADGASAVIFERISGSTEQSGTIRVEVSGSARVVRVEPSGLAHLD